MRPICYWQSLHKKLQSSIWMLTSDFETKTDIKIVFKKEDIDWRPLLIIESHDVFGFSPFKAVYYLRFCFPSIIKCDVMKFIINRNFLLKLNNYQTCTKRSVYFGPYSLYHPSGLTLLKPLSVLVAVLTLNF